MFCSYEPTWNTSNQQQTQMEELCHPCMVVVVRHMVGDNEADIQRRAAEIVHWIPCIDAQFAESWIVHRTYFHDALL